MSETTLSQLKIHKLTRAQYDAIQSPAAHELYLVSDDPEPESVATVTVLPTSAVAARSRDVYRVVVDQPSQAVAVALPALASNKVLDIEVVMEIGTGAGIGSISFTVNGSAQTPIWLGGSTPTWTPEKRGGLAVRLLNIEGLYTLLANKYGEW